MSTERAVNLAWVSAGLGSRGRLIYQPILSGYQPISEGYQPVWVVYQPIRRRYQPILEFISQFSVYQPIIFQI
ncbi:hypothetical protein ACLIA0_05695 [Bacillaceae bacterium W0354]